MSRAMSSLVAGPHTKLLQADLRRANENGPSITGGSVSCIRGHAKGTRKDRLPLPAGRGDYASR